MKKINWLTTLLVAVLFSFAACTGSTEQAEDQADAAETAVEEVVEETTDMVDSLSAEMDSLSAEVDSTMMGGEEASNEESEN